MIKKILKGFAYLLVLLVVAAVVVYVATGPQAPAADTRSAAWLAAGPYRVDSKEFLFVDGSRPTPENRGVPAKRERSLLVTMWYPRGDDGPHPLVVHSHGILSNRKEMPYLAKALASRGYVVAALDFPLSSGSTEGGATPTDIANQPGDVSFVIDSVLELTGAVKPFDGEIDTTRIGITGYSLGGLTSYLTTYHPRLRDPRLRAAVAIAGLSAAFSPAYFTTTDIPYLAISGTADALIEHDRNAFDLPRRNPHAALVTIVGGTHLGFLGMADPLFRFMDNPDTLGCQGVMSVVGDDPNALFGTLGDAGDGVDMQRSLPGLCDYGFPPATHPGRQRMITQAAVTAFFESVFSPQQEVRNTARDFLRRYLGEDFEEVDFTGSL